MKMTKGKCRYCYQNTGRLTILTPYGRCQKCEDIFRAWTKGLHKREFKDAEIIPSTNAQTSNNR